MNTKYSLVIDKTRVRMAFVLSIVLNGMYVIGYIGILEDVLDVSKISKIFFTSIFISILLYLLSAFPKYKNKYFIASLIIFVYTITFYMILLSSKMVDPLVIFFSILSSIILTYCGDCINEINKNTKKTIILFFIYCLLITVGILILKSNLRHFSMDFYMLSKYCLILCSFFSIIGFSAVPASFYFMKEGVQIFNQTSIKSKSKIIGRSNIFLTKGYPMVIKIIYCLTFFLNIFSFFSSNIGYAIISESLFNFLLYFLYLWPIGKKFGKNSTRKKILSTIIFICGVCWSVWAYYNGLSFQLLIIYLGNHFLFSYSILWLD